MKIKILEAKGRSTKLVYLTQFKIRNGCIELGIPLWIIIFLLKLGLKGLRFMDLHMDKGWIMGRRDICMYHYGGGE